MRKNRPINPYPTSGFVGQTAHTAFEKGVEAAYDYLLKNINIDTLANEIYISVVIPDTIWWDDLTEDMKEAWRQGARAALRILKGETD